MSGDHSNPTPAFDSDFLLELRRWSMDRRWRERVDASRRDLKVGDIGIDTLDFFEDPAGNLNGVFTRLFVD